MLSLTKGLHPEHQAGILLPRRLTLGTRHGNCHVCITKPGWVVTDARPPGGEAETEKRGFPGFSTGPQNGKPAFRESLSLVKNRKAI